MSAVALTLMVTVGLASAQDSGSSAVPIAAGQGAPRERAAILGRKISLHLDRVSLESALTAVASQGHVRLAYSRYLVPTDRIVSLIVDTITVADALSVLLRDTGLDVFVTAHGWIALQRAGASPFGNAAQQRSSITGRVTDAVTHAPLDQVAIRIEGPGLGAVSAADGRYAVSNVPAGTYRVTARRVGYTPLTNTVTVATDSTSAANFALTAAPTRLNEMVTTAVGDQRRYEVGNTISTINADSIAPTAPITSLTDLISARAPGVEVLETSGMTGSGEAIRIRGISSLVLQSDPILIVDGVRQDNSAGGDLGPYFTSVTGLGEGTHPTPARLNDIDFNDIESIDVLKGPSASTEYGTDAANGVIVITTKHGTAGKPEWRVSAEQGESAIPGHFPNGYYSWGHTTDGAHTPVNCPLIAGSFALGSFGSTAGNCVVDSTTQWNPLNHAATSIFGTGNRAKYDVSVNGGSDALRYFVAGGLSNETGIVHVPPVFKELADTAGLGLPGSALHPNGEQQRSARVNTAIKLGSTADLTVTGSYLSTYQQTPEATNLYSAALAAPALSSAAFYYGYVGPQSSGGTPLASLSQLGSQNTNRVTGGLTANWRPVEWLVGHATAGFDHGSQRDEELSYPLAKSTYEYYPSSLGLVDATTDVYSVDLRGAATASLAREVRSVTSGGAQLVDTRTAGQGALTFEITPTNLTLNGATGPAVTQLGNRQATLGGYGEEQISLAGRVFLTGALRVDAGSGFGRAYATAVYPKASWSWLVLDRGLTTIRLRGAFGQSGVQPLNGAAATLYATSIAYLGGGNVTTYPFNWPGNAHLRPERSEEFEAGLDIGGWGNRLSLELTGYSKATRDALVNVNLSGDACCYTYQENVGEVQNRGVEGTVTVGLLQGRTVTWDIAVNASINHNKLISLAPSARAQILPIESIVFNFRQAPGFPLYGIWAPGVRYADVNHDGAIEANEVTLTDSSLYVGPSLPTQETSVSTHVGLWRGAVTVGGLVDYRGGFRIANIDALNADFIGKSRQANDPTTPLWLQARAAASRAIAVYPLSAPYAEDGSFVRIREVSVTYVVPRGLVRALRMQNASVTAAVRNLALWTRYTGVDPEVSNPYSGTNQPAPTSGGYSVNNDVRGQFGAVPLTRSWVARLNVGL